MFQPRNHEILEVLDYLASVAGDAVEVGRVLAAERTGLARPEILSTRSWAEGGRQQLNGEESS